MAKLDYNIVVIGAGSAGLVASYVAAAAKAKVALIERHKMGGDCLNTGCVPSKALIRSASFLFDAKRAKSLGFKSAQVDFDFADIMERVQRVISQVEPHDSVARYTGLGVDCFEGEAKIVSPFEVEVGGKKLTTRAIIVAAGARPFVPPIKGLDKVEYYTSDTIWNIRKLPKRLAVIGGGPIGSELTQCFAIFGSEVTQVEGSARIMMREDEDAAALVMQKFRDSGVNILTETRAEEVVVENGEKFLICADKNSGAKTRVAFDDLLLAVGRAPNGDSVPGLKEAGVKINSRGAVEVDEKLTTAVPNIYACGDIIGSYQFTHTAGHAGYYAATNALFAPLRRRVDWSVVPWCTFTRPEVARAGLNEIEARQKQIAFEVTKYGIDDLDRAIADEEAEGFVKLITPPGSGKILGVTIVGAHAGDLLHEYIVAMKNGINLGGVMGAIHIYPTLAEANKFAASEWRKNNLPQAALRLSEKICAWRRN
jgi:pyruvate/2-oxoglutarate dehydrogenase complex dihydrolipoamide dehydrogenase (E3) component